MYNNNYMRLHPFNQIRIGTEENKCLEIGFEENKSLEFALAVKSVS